MPFNTHQLRNALKVLVEEDPKLADLLNPVIDDRACLDTFAGILTKVYDDNYNRPTLSNYTVSAKLGSVFPMDMLRHSDSWPASADDATLIEKVVVGGFERIGMPKIVEINLQTCASPVSMIMSEKRWKSFGWDCSYADTVDHVSEVRA